MLTLCVDDLTWPSNNPSGAIIIFSHRGAPGSQKSCNLLRLTWLLNGAGGLSTQHSRACAVSCHISKYQGLGNLKPCVSSSKFMLSKLYHLMCFVRLSRVLFFFLKILFIYVRERE